MIRLENVTVILDDKVILDDISVDIPSNLSTVILGRSGAGKSVLLKTVERFFYPFKGEVFCDDVDILALSEKDMGYLRKSFGYLFQNGALLDSLTVYQNLALPLFEHTNLEEKEIIKRVKKNLELVSLSNVIDKYPSELSGGMVKRVSLARAIMLQPKYIFYDEPTTGLDPITGQEIISLIKRLSETLKVTSVIITHDLECVKQLADYVIMIHNKKIHFQGDLESFYNKDDDFIASFLRKMEI